MALKILVYLPHCAVTGGNGPRQTLMGVGHLVSYWLYLTRLGA